MKTRLRTTSGPLLVALLALSAHAEAAPVTGKPQSRPKAGATAKPVARPAARPTKPAVQKPAAAAQKPAARSAKPAAPKPAAAAEKPAVRKPAAAPPAKPAAPRVIIRPEHDDHVDITLPGFVRVKQQQEPAIASVSAVKPVPAPAPPAARTPEISAAETPVEPDRPAEPAPDPVVPAQPAAELVAVMPPVPKRPRKEAAVTLPDPKPEAPGIAISVPARPEIMLNVPAVASPEPFPAPSTEATASGSGLSIMPASTGEAEIAGLDAEADAPLPDAVEVVIPETTPLEPEVHAEDLAASAGPKADPASPESTAAAEGISETASDPAPAAAAMPLVQLDTAPIAEDLSLESTAAEPASLVAETGPALTTLTPEASAGPASVTVAATTPALDELMPPAPEPDLPAADMPPSVESMERDLLNEIRDRRIAERNPLLPSLDVEPREFVSNADSVLPDTFSEQTPRRAENLPKKAPIRAPTKLGAIDVVSDGRTDYDEKNSSVLFSDEVQLSTKRFRLRADRLTVKMKPGTQELESAIATGEVLVEMTPENGEPAFAQAGKAIYNPLTGEIRLTDWPKIQESTKSHIATEAGTVMYLYTDGRMRTEGSNRTIFQ